MNERIKEFMLEAGYAAPELALRAQKLVELVIRECIAAHEDHYGIDILTECFNDHVGLETGNWNLNYTEGYSGVPAALNDYKDRIIEVEYNTGVRAKGKPDSWFLMWDTLRRGGHIVKWRFV